MEFTSQALAHFIIVGLLSVVIPVGAVIFYKLRCKEAPLSAAFTGAGVFLVFVVILESLLHSAVLPLVSGNAAATIIYGTLAAGIFEETGRFIAFKTILRRKTAPQTAIMYGLGHGGFEWLFICGTAALSALVIAAMCGSMGAEAFAEMSSQGSEEIKAAVLAQIEGYTQCTLATTAATLIERVIAMTLHISLSVLVFESARTKGRLWLYPAAVLMHAAMDTPAGLYQQAVIPLWACEALMAAVAAITAVWAVILYKGMKQKTHA